MGLDVRQVTASPLIWNTLSSYVSWLPATGQWQQWVDDTGFRPFFDIHYIILAMPRGSFNVQEPGNMGSITLVAQGEFDPEQLKNWAKSVGWLEMKIRPDGNLILNTTGVTDTGYAAIIDNPITASVSAGRYWSSCSISRGVNAGRSR